MNTTKTNKTKSLPSLMILYCSTNITSFRILLKKKYENQNLTLSELNPQRINKDIYFSYSVVTHNSLIRNINKKN